MQRETSWSKRWRRILWIAVFGWWLGSLGYSESTFPPGWADAVRGPEEATRRGGIGLGTGRQAEGQSFCRAEVFQKGLPPIKPVDTRWMGAMAPSEAAVFADAEDGRLDHHSLFRAALIAGGTLEPKLLQKYETKFHQWVRQLQKHTPKAQQPLKQAELIFRFMHQNILTGGYNAQASELAHTLQSGRYNCLSASVLYQCLLEAFGIEAWAWEMGTHARTQIQLQGQILDVETTCPQWFDLIQEGSLRGAGTLLTEPEALLWDTRGKRRPVGTQEAGSRAGRSPSLLPPLGQAEPGTRIDDVGLLALIYYNRGVDFLLQGDYKEALAANAKALRLAPGHPRAWGNFLAGMNNWAVALGRAGQHRQAVQLLQEGLRLAPAYEPFEANWVYLHTRWAERLSQEGQFAEAWKVLEEGVKEVPAFGPRFRAMQLKVARDWTGEYVSRGQYFQAVALWENVRQLLGPGPDVLEAERAVWETLAKSFPLPAAILGMPNSSAVSASVVGPEMP